MFRGDAIGDSNASAVMRQLIDWSVSVSTGADKATEFRLVMWHFLAAFSFEAEPNGYAAPADLDRPPQLVTVQSELLEKIAKVGNPSSAYLGGLIAYAAAGSQTIYAESVVEALTGGIVPSWELINGLLNVLELWEGQRIGGDERDRYFSLLRTAEQDIAEAKASAPTASPTALRGTAYLSRHQIADLLKLRPTADFVGGLFVSESDKNDSFSPAYSSSAKVVKDDVTAHILVVIRGVKVGAAVLVGIEPMSVGRATHNDVRLNHETVSGRHAVFRTDNDGQLVVSDRISTNGTSVNDSMIDSDRKLSPNDRVQLGAVVLVYLGPVALKAGDLVAAVVSDIRELVKSSGLLLS